MNPKFFTKNTNDVTFQDRKDEIMAQIDKYDATMLSYLARLYEAMNGEKMDFTKIKNAVDALAIFNKKAEYSYLNNLLYPEKCKGVKIPSPIPVPSCSFQLHNCVTLSTNSSGNLAFVFNPFFLANANDFKTVVKIDSDQGNYRLTETSFLTTLWVNNNGSLSGYEPNDNWDPINIGQAIPNVYDQYRLVSASIVVKYIGRLDITSGVIGGAIIYDDNKYVGGLIKTENEDSSSVALTLTGNPGLSKYGNFDLAMDSFYHQENLCLEGMRELYFPLDNSYEEYTKLAGNSNIGSIIHTPGKYLLKFDDSDAYKSGFNYFVYVLGAPPSSSCFKVDIYCNYECLPNASFLNYLPLSMSPDSISNAEKKNAIAVVQQKPIMNLKDKEALVVSKPSIWDKLKNKFSNMLPGIGKLISWGLTSMIPGLKPGLALAGTMINAIGGNEPAPQEQARPAPMYEDVE